jgi:hypothetical protein
VTDTNLSKVNLLFTLLLGFNSICSGEWAHRERELHIYDGERETLSESERVTLSFPHDGMMMVMMIIPYHIFTHQFHHYSHSSQPNRGENKPKRIPKVEKGVRSSKQTTTRTTIATHTGLGWTRQEGNGEILSRKESKGGQGRSVVGSFECFTSSGCTNQTKSCEMTFSMT